MAGQSQLEMPPLYVAHWRQGGPQPAHVWPDAVGLPVETCLRRVWISAGPPARTPDGEAEHYTGTSAYRFLLEFITGLHSAIPGESNVLGQFRQAWFRWRNSTPAAVATLAFTVDALLRDARRIRAQHLQGVGGESYGSLVRRLIRPGRSDRILIVGAGKLARSIWPFFQQHAVAAWNHRDATGEIPQWLGRFSPAEGPDAARWARHVILTTPPDTDNDARWSHWLSAAAPATVAHLGHGKAGAFHVDGTARLFFLEQLFALRQAQANVRSLQIERARKACLELANARYTQPAIEPRRIRARA